MGGTAGGDRAGGRRVCQYCFGGDLVGGLRADWGGEAVSAELDRFRDVLLVWRYRSSEDEHGWDYWITVEPYRADVAAVADFTGRVFGVAARTSEPFL